MITSKPSTSTLPQTLIAACALAILGCSSANLRANTEFDVPNGATDLNSLATTTASDLTFTNTAYSPAALTAASALSIGTLNDLSGTALTISGAGAITFNGGTNVVSPNAADLLYVASGGSLAIGNNIILTTATAAGNFDIVGTSTLSGIISGTGFGFTKIGAGTLTLSGANTFTGGVTATAGTVKLGSSSALGGGAYSISGTTTDLNGQTIDNAFLSGGNFDVFTNSSATTANVASGFNQAGSAGVTISDFTVNGTGDINWSGAIRRTNFNGTVTKSGSNTLTLGGAGGDYTGMAYSVNGGTLALGLTGGTFNSGTITVASGANVSGASASGVTQTVGSQITGAGTFTQSGAGTTIFNTANTYTGGTTVNAGVLQLNVGGGNGTIGGVVTINAGGTLRTNASDALGFNGGTQTVSLVNVNGGTFDNAAAGNNGFATAFALTGGSVTSSGGGAINFSPSATVTLSSTASATTSTFSAPIALRGATLLPITVASGTTASGIDLSISGIINQNGGSYGISKEGAGLLQLSGANTYNGATAINGGTVRVGVATVTGTSGALGVNSNVTLANTAGVALDLNNFNTTLGFLAGGGTTGGNLTLGSATLTVGQNNGGGTFAGVISGSGAIIKTGTGLEELDGASSYSGGTTISAGTLQTNNSTNAAFGTGVVTQNAGTLAFNGNGSATRT